MEPQFRVKPILSHSSTMALKSVSNRLVYNMHTGYLFVCNDIRSNVLLALFFGALGASVAPSLSMGESRSLSHIVASAPRALLWSWANLFLFNLHNQRHSAAIAEDAINKPWRPLPAKRLTQEQATLVIYAMYPTMLAISLTFGGLVPSVLEAFLCLWHNELGGDSDPFLKNTLTAFGLACFLAGPLEVITGRSIFSGNSEAAIWLFMIAIAIATTVHAQDFRDMEGDKATGRSTVPLAMGDTESRALLAIGVVGWTYAAGLFWGVSWRETITGWMFGMVMVGNALLDRSMDGDKRTWKLWTFWMLGLFLVPFLKEVKI
ncbi:uncharacterized protein GGS25DRAFT_508282 [Hypoxylon fragiforme]|uniref:uncharacterized protein n=1 Tax=Hypoxylon fragiforme TaxID=63214 RepID=UPI0020C67148|nr:uncharacterized protein GGS25DRAFT_508282 [Hypoxylon fragiforme]KAI2604446.1 hypothetical protein GGS25DRAFT_508282 [Hypoxylon fragiforme]